MRFNPKNACLMLMLEQVQKMWRFCGLSSSPGEIPWS